jgi:hypothetical protein
MVIMSRNIDFLEEQYPSDRAEKIAEFSMSAKLHSGAGRVVHGMKTNSSRRWAVSAPLMGAVILASATGVQSQSAADVQKAIGILTNPSNSPQERINAAWNLAALGQDSDSAAQALIGVPSSDPNPAVRSAAAVALGSAAFPSASPIQALIQALNADSSPEVRLSAVKGLEVIGVGTSAAEERRS